MESVPLAAFLFINVCIFVGFYSQLVRSSFWMGHYQSQVFWYNQSLSLKHTLQYEVSWIAESSSVFINLLFSNSFSLCVPIYTAFISTLLQFEFIASNVQIDSIVLSNIQLSVVSFEWCKCPFMKKKHGPKILFSEMAE